MATASIGARRFASDVLDRVRPSNGAVPKQAAGGQGAGAGTCPEVTVDDEVGAHDGHVFVGGLAAALPFVPCIAATATTLAYVLRLGDEVEWRGRWEDNLAAIAVGLTVALGVWLVAGWRCGHFARPAHANTSSYDLLWTRLRQLQTRCAVFCAAGRDWAGVDPQAGCAACREAEAQCRLVAADLKRNGLQWVMATGYDTQWRRLHRAEEALLEVEPRVTLANEALYDYQRLRGSGLDDFERLTSQMTWALRQLDLADCVEAPAAGLATAGASPNGGNGKRGRVRPAPEARLRAVLREIRYAINDFRDRQTAGLIRARNRLLKTVVVTSLGSYLLLGLAIAAEAPRATVAAVAGCFLVGATVGLFNRMRVESQMDCAVEDYGLSVARLVHTPLFSGLAAVAGVFLSAAVAVAVTNAVLQGDGGAAGSATGTETVPPAAQEVAADRLPSVTEVFDLEANPFALVVAAVFGLTPDLVINRLREQTEQMADNLRKTQPLTATAEKEAAA